MTEPPKKPVIIGITGASGSVYGLRMAAVLLSLHQEVHLILTDMGRRTLALETGVDTEITVQVLQQRFPDLAVPEVGLYRHHPQDFAAPPSSGSFHFQAVMVAPCSMHTLGAIASGLSLNLLQRAAGVALKERMPLILVPRESPLSTIHLEAMLRLSQAGAMILPASPGFYHQPQSVMDLVDFVVVRSLKQIGLHWDRIPPWSGA